MSFTSDKPLSPAEMFQQYFEHSPYSDYSFWKKSSVKVLELYNNEFKKLKKEIKVLDAELEEIKGFDEFSNRLLLDGWDVCEDEALSLDSQNNQILPLLFVGAFNDFENSFKSLITIALDFFSKYQSTEKVEIAKSNLLKAWKIEDIKKTLCRADLLCISQKRNLNKLWIAIDAHQELRHVLAHNENPIPAHKNKRIKKVRGIKNVSIDERNYVKIDDLKVIKNSCNLYECFMHELIDELGNKLQR